MRCHIGTSGWTYPHWRGVFYPGEIPRSAWLAYYSSRFPTVELNATFYRLPRPSTFEKWSNDTGGDFLWSLKGNRYITHIKRLRDVSKEITLMYESFAPLKKKVAVILFQLPPSLKYDHALINDFISLLSGDYRYAFEFRHATWLTDALYALLHDHEIAFCISDTAGRFPYAEQVTADFVYLRLHGSTRLYASLYSNGELRAWMEKLLGWGRESYVYFDNDFKGHAARNALKMAELMAPFDAG